MAFEKAYIEHKLSEHDDNIAHTADAIGIERSHLYKKIKTFGLKP
jgi:two-component system nitrogen regulation response regulator NtrX